VRWIEFPVETEVLQNKEIIQIIFLATGMIILILYSNSMPADAFFIIHDANY